MYNRNIIFFLIYCYSCFSLHFLISNHKLLTKKLQHQDFTQYHSFNNHVSIHSFIMFCQSIPSCNTLRIVTVLDSSSTVLNNNNKHPQRIDLLSCSYIFFYFLNHLKCSINLNLGFFFSSNIEIIIIAFFSQLLQHSYFSA